MRVLNLIILGFFISLLEFGFINSVQAQCEPYIRIDGEIVLANETIPSGLVLPIWLKVGQTLSVGISVRSISVIEFTEVNNALEYSQVLSINSSTPVSVPTGKVWKVESIVKHPQIAGGINKVVYNMAGTSSFTVPYCTEYICIEAWGAGGGGQASNKSSYTNGRGGGGGAYSQDCFEVTPGDTYTVTVGSGGVGGSASGGAGTSGTASSVSSLITANGGSGGSSSGGQGGTASSIANGLSIPGFQGATGSYYPGNNTYGYGGNGGNGANGGEGGIGKLGANGTDGKSPGGGGSGGGANGSSLYAGGNGADGQVIIYW